MHVYNLSVIMIAMLTHLISAIFKVLRNSNFSELYSKRLHVGVALQFFIHGIYQLIIFYEYK